MMALLLVLVQSSPEEWVQRLDEGDDAERRAAVEALAKIGEPARAAVAKCRDAWWRAVALAELDARRDGGDAWKEPVRVTLDLPDRPIREIVQHLADQLKLPIQVPSSERRLTVRIEGATWFEALEALWNAGEIDFQLGRDGTWTCETPEDSRKFLHLHRGFEVSAIDLEQITTSNLREPPKSELRLGIAVRGDPAVRVLSLSDLRVLEAMDDTGRSLKSESAALPPETAARTPRDRSARGLNLRLDVGAPAATKIERIRGVVRVRLAKKSVSLSFSKLGSATGVVEKVEAGIKARLGPHSRRADRDFTTSLELESGTEAGLWPEAAEIRAVDSAGNAWILRSSTRTVSNTSANYRLTYRNPGGSDGPETLSFTVVTESYERDLHFELRDIPLR